MNEHARCLELAVAAIDFALSPAEQRQVTRHLDECSSCSRLERAIRLDAARVSALPDIQAPHRVRSAILDAAVAQPAPSLLGRPLLAFATLLLLVALAGAGGVLAERLHDLLPEIFPQVVMPTPLVSPRASGTPVPEAKVTWSGPFNAGTGYVEDAAGGDARLVAVGWDGTAPSAWTSTDGRTWLQASLPDATGRMEAVTQTPSGWLAVGFVTVVQTGFDTPFQSAAAWTSADGLTWTRVAAKPDLDLGSGFGTDWPVVGMADVISTGTGYVAVGADLHSAAVWTSNDGLNWTRQTVQDAENRSLAAVREFKGRLIAVGTKGDVGGEATIVTSTDGGRTWSETAVPEFSGMLRHLETDGTTLVAAGSVASGAAEAHLSGVWRSSDGVSWTAVPGPADEGCGNGMAIGSIAPLSTGGFMAVGAFSCSGETYTAAIWRSPDGSTWSRQNSANTPSASGLTVWCRGPGGLFVVFVEGDTPAIGVWTGVEER